jgi:hypothetical protein
LTNIVLPAGVHPTVEVTEPSNGHIGPFVVAVILFIVATIVSVWIAGPPL